MQLPLPLAKISRRQLILRILQASGAAVVSSGIATQLAGCDSDGNAGATFEHGVASGDPATDGVIIWTRATPIDGGSPRVNWEVAEDKDFNQLVVVDAAVARAEHDYTVKVDVRGLQPGRTYYYRFYSGPGASVVGTTRTLPADDVTQVKFGVVSCSNYPAGLFNVYQALAAETGLDAIIHLGDYIYEYGRDGYASDNARALGREVNPEGEILALADYRARYAQYRTDPDLQAAHQAAPFICVWDDHEVTNDAWREGAENHNEGEGIYTERLAAALKAYAEWMPLRPPVDEQPATLARSFRYGNLINLCMLDTRIIGRDQQLSLTDYFDAEGAFDAAAFVAALSAPERTLLGQPQLTWLQEQLAADCTWQVLGQQVLMGRMELPAAVATQQLSIPQFAELAQLAQLAATTPEVLTEQQLQQVATQGHLLQMGSLPYNLDAWDGYPVERAVLLTTAAHYNANLLVLAGDTHNAWASNLMLDDQPVGVEFATSSVSSPGLEQYLGLTATEQVLQTEAALTQLIDGLQYSNLSDRGYMLLTVTETRATAQWKFVSTIQAPEFTLLPEREASRTVQANSHSIGA